MDPIEYLRIIRRRWPAVAVLFLLGVVAGYLTAKPGGAVTTGSSPSQYQATVLLGLPANSADPTGLSLDGMAVIATSGQTPSMTAKALHDSGGGSDVLSHVQVTPNDTANFLQVTGTGPTAPRAVDLANTFSAQFITALNDQLAADYHSTLKSDRTQLKSLSSVVSKLQSEPSTSLVQSELSQARSQYSQQYVSYQQLLTTGPSHTNLRVVESASPSTAVFQAGSGATRVLVPSGRKTRTGLGGLAGLILGLGVAFVWERVDTKIRTREQAEKSFGLPVIGEVSVRGPRGMSARGGKNLVVVSNPVSAAAESFRMLQTDLALPDPPRQENGGRSRAILLCSPRPLEGKELVLANLAASFSEAGTSVALVAGDSFDRSLPILVGTPGAPTPSAPKKGAGPSPRDSGASSFPDPSSTSMEGVSLFLNGTRPGTASRQSPGHTELVTMARGAADVVLVDTPPVLITHDAGRISSVVDSVVLMCELGRVTSKEAATAAGMLRRVGAPLQGVVVVNGASPLARLVPARH